ncbi:YhgE/Pip family protein [Nocardioides guangzhouensis]|nr:YhgE/Pip family protein [Nocardioides guangzhouensis]
MSSSLTPEFGEPGEAVPWRSLALVGLVLPLVAAAVLVWATTGRQDNLDRIPVAVVNNDQIIQQPQPMAAGRALAASLTEPGSGQSNLDWTLADTDDAAAGLKNGQYYAVLTIPEDFSKSILSTGTDKPVQGKLTLVSNGAASSTVPYISQATAAAAATALGQQSTQGYLGQVYDGFNQLAQNNQKTASSGEQLAQGTNQVAQGAAQLSTGAAQLSTGLDQLSTGAAELATGTGSLSTGADDLAGGARRLATGANQLEDGIGGVAEGAQALATRQAGYAGDAHTVASGSAKVAEAAGLLKRGSRGLAIDVRALAATCQREGGSTRFCNALGRARDRAGRVAAGAAAVSRLTNGVARADKGLATGADALAAGSRSLASGANELSAAGQQVSSGADDVRSGAVSLASGAAETDQAAGRLAAGAASSASGGQQLASGASSLSSGAISADNGAQQLSQGLDKLAKQSPTYSKDEQKALETVVSEPVALTSSVEHTEHANGWLIGVVLGVILWLAALLGVMRRDIGKVLRHSSSPISSRRLTEVQLRPAVALALAQGVAVLVAVLLLRVGMASPVKFGLLTLLAAVTFTLVGLVLRWAWGVAGLLAFVLFLLLQVAALGNVLPIETAPEPLQMLNRLLPLPAYVNAASQLVTGGSVGSLAGTVTVLVVWGLGASLVALLLVRKRRVARAPVVATE